MASTNAIEAYQSAYNSYSTKNSNATSMEEYLAGTVADSSSDDSGSLKSRLRSRIDALLAGIPQSGGKLTFQDVLDYRDQLREDFEAQAKADLEALGVDTDLDFTLSYDADTNTVTADSGHPDKKVIDWYFANNEEMTEAFAQVVTYSNLAKPAETSVSAEQMVHQLQLDTMSAWFSDNLSTSSLSSGLAGMGTLMFSGTGESTFFGLDLMV